MDDPSLQITKDSESHLSTLDDANLLKLAKSGDTQAFGILYERYAVEIYRFVYVQLPDFMEAEDLTSDVFLRAWSSLSRYQERGFPFSAFLYKIARNALIDFHRKSKGVVENLPSNLVDRMGDDSLLGDQEHQNLWESMKDIKADYRTVLVLRFINGLSPKEISQIMGRSVGAIRVLQHRALKAMRKKWRKFEN